VGWFGVALGLVPVHFEQKTVAVDADEKNQFEAKKCFQESS